jgi:cytochrome c oxidase subunit IV
MSEHTHHVGSLKTYTLIFILLLALTGITTAVAYVDLGPLSTVVALAIACVKMLLVALWFMHVKESSRLTKLVVSGALVWLLIMIGMTMGDVISRGWVAGGR